MCFLYELHEYIESLKEKYNFEGKSSDNIEDIESNIIDIYYNNNIYNLKEQINTICSQLTIEASEASEKREKIIKEMEENIIDIYGINKKKKKEYYSYICDIKNIIIE
jgi:ACT domain-containing protein